MEILHALGELVEFIGFFGGIGLVILASNKAKIDKMRAEREIMQQSFAPRGEGVSADVSAELKALKAQVSEMQNTGHQFDLSFDAALSRLEERVSRVETKTAVPPAAQAEPLQRLGQG